MNSRYLNSVGQVMSGDRGDGARGFEDSGAQEGSGFWINSIPRVLGLKTGPSSTVPVEVADTTETDESTETDSKEYAGDENPSAPFVASTPDREASFETEMDEDDPGEGDPNPFEPSEYVFPDIGEMNDLLSRYALTSERLSGNLDEFKNHVSEQYNIISKIGSKYAEILQSSIAMTSSVEESESRRTDLTNAIEQIHEQRVELAEQVQEIYANLRIRVEQLNHELSESMPFRTDLAKIPDCDPLSDLSDIIASVMERYEVVQFTLKQNADNTKGYLASMSPGDNLYAKIKERNDVFNDKIDLLEPFLHSSLPLLKLETEQVMDSYRLLSRNYDNLRKSIFNHLARIKDANQQLVSTATVLNQLYGVFDDAPQIMEDADVDVLAARIDALTAKNNPV